VKAQDGSDAGFRRSRLVIRIVVIWIAVAGLLQLWGAVLPGVSVSDWRAALAGAALIGLANGVVWPALIRFALPVTVLTLGLGALALNALMVLACAAIVPNFEIDDFWWGVLLVLCLAVSTTVLTSLLALDDEDVWRRHVVRRAQSRDAIRSDVPGVVFLEIDGLAHEVLVRAIRDGNAPAMSRWIHEGSHRLIRWECDWSSQTSASQAGILHGSNEGIVAFRWWDKAAGRAVVSSQARDVMALEQRLSDGKGLLHADGASRANLFSGDAPHSLLTVSTVLRRDRSGKLGADYQAYFSAPYNIARTIVLVLGDIVREIWQAAGQRRLDVQPRIHRGFPYPVLRAWMVVIQRDLQVQAVVGDIYAGRPVVYSTFSGYDEVAHHSGIERRETLDVLRGLDRQIFRISQAMQDAPRPYRLVVLSDHGQSQGATFKQRYGDTLEDLVSRACRTDDVAAKQESDEAFTYMGAAANEVAGGKGALASTVRAGTRGKRVDGTVVLGEDDRELAAKDDLPEVVVFASGCLGLISFPRQPGRMTAEQIRERYPLLLPALLEHPGVGFALVRSNDGPVVHGPKGVRHLERDEAEGADPLEPYGPRAPEHVLRTDGFEGCADIMVNSTFWTETGEVAAFEELVGSHGGLGGPQSFPFLLVPSEWSPPKADIVGPGAVHEQLRVWLTELGHDDYA
jgi:uncharacterized membrane protein YvlD (DUF360 family)